jgi:hypothetical protein
MGGETMQTITAAISRDRLDAMDDQLALVVSDLDEIASVLEPRSVDEDGQLIAELAGDRDAIARLVAFVCNVETMAASMLTYCAQIKAASLGIYSELRDAA